MTRFWGKVRKTRGCWVFTGALDANGYGRFSYGGRCRLAHRVAWRLLRGRIPRGKFVLHHCDNPACVRPGPRHTFLGTQRDNMRDAQAKGRTRGTFKPKRRCKYGHKFEGWYTRRRDGRRLRYCKTCASRTNNTDRARENKHRWYLAHRQLKRNGRGRPVVYG